MILLQGDSFPIWFSLKLNGENLTPATASDVTVRIGDLLHYRMREGRTGYSQERGKWFFVPTQDETASLAPESYRVTAEVQFRNRPVSYNRCVHIGTIHIQIGNPGEDINQAAIAGLSGSIEAEVVLGVSGVTFTPKWNGTRLEWENDGGMENPESRELRGPAGPVGPMGPAGVQGPPGTNGLMYKSLADAVADINAGTAERVSAEGGRVKVSTGDDGLPCVTALADLTENNPLDIQTDMRMVLTGHSLTLGADDACLNFAAGTDCEIVGGSITKTSGGSASSCVIILANGNLKLKGVRAKISGTFSTFAMAVKATATCSLLELDGCTIEADDQTASGTHYNRCIQTQAAKAVLRDTEVIANGNSFVEAVMVLGTRAEIGNSSIRANTNSNTANQFAYGINVYSEAVTVSIKDSTIFADAPGDSSDGNDSFAVGIMNLGTLIAENTDITGTHNGVNNHHRMYVQGGALNGYSHGGAYFTHGPGGEAYINDAVFRCGNYTGAHDFTTDRTAAFAACYIGGGTSEKCSNMTIYMDGCTFDNDESVENRAIVMRGTSNEQNNTLNLSNCTILNGATIRIDNDTLRLNAGVGADITADMIASTPGALVQTGKLYRRAGPGQMLTGNDLNRLILYLEGLV